MAWPVLHVLAAATLHADVIWTPIIVPSRRGGDTLMLEVAPPSADGRGPVLHSFAFTGTLLPSTPCAVQLDRLARVEIGKCCMQFQPAIPALQATYICMIHWVQVTHA